MQPNLVTDKTQRNASPAYALAYAALLPSLVRVAREHGYALAVHGSMRTDFDLIAVPWVEGASSQYDLIDALAECIGGVATFRTRLSNKEAVNKPHGRTAYSIVNRTAVDVMPEGGRFPWLDISVMPMVADSAENTTVGDSHEPKNY